jgi:uncharacterized protein (TIGR03083 family)
MEPDGLLAALELESRRVLDVDAARMEADVAWCPGWTVADVVAHLGRVQRWGTSLSVEPGSWTRFRETSEPPRGVTELLEWYAAGIGPMLAAFDGADLDVVVNTWAGERPRGWWLRRLTHETAVHRFDAQAPIAVAAPIDATVAADGIDELFEVFLPRVRDGLLGSGETLHVHATDVDEGEWQLAFDADDVRVERSHAKADGALRGPAGELLLVLWNRRPLDEAGVEVFGDRAVVQRWSTAFRI